MTSMSVAPVSAQPDISSPFQPCTDAVVDPALAESLCTRRQVALDPQAQTDSPGTHAKIDLFIRQFPPEGGAAPRGHVWLVAGGPGESGASFYGIIATMRRAFPGYVLMVPDHRGTGLSTRLCPTEEAPDSPGGLALAGEEWGSCPQAMAADPARTAAFTVTNAAYDLARLIADLRDDGSTHIYAVSYGTQLVLRMMTVAPVAVDSLILDGLVPLEGSAEADLGRRTAIVDAVGRSLLDADRQAAYRTLLARDDAPWRVTVPAGDLRVTMASLLSFPETRSAIPAIIDGLSRDDPALLLQTIASRDALASGVSRFAQSPPSLPLVMLVSGSENNDRRAIDAQTIAAESADALFVSPLPALLPRIVAPLYPRDRYYGVTPPALPRTLVVQGTLDPNTPYDAALRHIDQLKAVGRVDLATVEGGAHFIALTAPDCFVAIAVVHLDGSAIDRCQQP